eukprot:1273907-Prymnesium_polylepis.1
MPAQEGTSTCRTAPLTEMSRARPPTTDCLARGCPSRARASLPCRRRMRRVPFGRLQIRVCKLAGCLA